ncbi:MAG: autotransporter outer membrane beta-barrel domain-containing protein, partial [Pyramidobacter sp.]|nr:autotransporter outer membrane beta-barrel domain-containing protein [Pyramidobacter sp.]
AADGGAIWAGTGATITADRARFLAAGDSVYVENGAITVKGSLEMANTSFTAQTGGISVGGGTFKPHDVAHSDSVTADQLPQFYAPSGKVDLGGSKLALYNAFAEDTDHFERDVAYIQANEYDISGLKTSAESDYRHGVLHEEALAGGTKLWLEFGIASLTWKNGDGPWDVKTSQIWTLDSNPEGEKDYFYQSDHVTFAPTTGDAPVKITLQQDIVASSTTVKGSYAFSEHELRTGALELTAGDSSFAMPVTADDAKLTGGSLKLDETLTVKNSFAQSAGTKLTIAADETLAILNGDGTAALDASAGALHIAGIGAMNGGEAKTYKVAADFASLKPWDKNAVTTDAAGLRVEQTPDTDSATYYNLTVSCLGNIPLIWNGGGGTNVWKTGDTSKLWLRESDGTTPDDFYDGDSAAFTGTKSGTVTVNGTVKPEKMSVTGGTYTFKGGSVDANEVNFAGGEATVESALIAQTAALSGGKLKLSTPLKVTGSFTQNAGTTLTVAASETAAILNGSGTAALNAGGALFIEGIGALAGGTTKTYKIAENFASLVPWADADLGGDATGLRLSYAGVKGAHTYDVNVTALGNISLLWNGGSNTWAENDGNLLWLRESDVTTKDDFYGGDSVVFEANTEKQTVTLSSGLEADGMAVGGDYLFKGSDLKVRSLNVVGGESELAATVTADAAEQSGGSLKLSKTLTVHDSFTQSDAATLIVPAGLTEAVLSGAGTAALNAAGTLYIEGIGALADGVTKTFKVAEKFAKLTPWADGALTGDATGLRVEYAGKKSATAFDVTVTALGHIPLIWNGGMETWAETDGRKLWLRESDGTTKDDFYNGDSAIFPANGAAQKVTLSGALEPEAMTVNGSYVFAGSGSLKAGTLTVNGGRSEFAREITAEDGVLSGGELKLTKPLTVGKSFTQKSGSTLIVDVDSAETVLIGQSGAKLTVESGAKLYLANAQSSLDGVKYTVATGFDVASAWQNADVDGSAGGFGVKYAVSEESGSVIVTVTGEPYDGFPFILTAGQSLRGAASVGTALQNRGAGLLSAPASPIAFASGFKPMERGKVGGTWASAWYTHARVDNDTADMKFKNYGVTLGADKLLRSGASVGVAVNLGKTEGRGKGAFDGSDSDGKHIGISLYGAKNLGRGNVTLTGDVGFNWHRDDYDSTMFGSYYRARKAKSRVFTAGATAWWNLPARGKVGVKPFLGLRYSRFSMDDFTAEKNGTSWANIGGESVSQWTVPLGVKFDWTPVTTKKGWKIKPSVELAYVFAGGDRDMNVRVASVRGGSPVHETQMLSDKHNFRASLGLDAKRKNMTLGLGVNALLSSGQKDVAVNATVRWDL